MVTVNDKSKNRFAGLTAKTFATIAIGSTFAWADGPHSGKDDNGGPRIKLSKTKYMCIQDGGNKFLVCSLKGQGKTSKSKAFVTGSATITANVNV